MKRAIVRLLLVALIISGSIGVEHYATAQTPSGPTITSGTSAPNPADCTVTTVSSIYQRATAADGAAVVYVCRVTDALTTNVAWDPIAWNADV